jgi:DNA-directed RNA polymerase subunit F
VPRGEEEMNFIDFIIHVSKNPEVSKNFIDDLNNTKSTDELKIVLQKYDITAVDEDVKKIFENKNIIVKMQDNVVQPLY